MYTAIPAPPHSLLKSGPFGRRATSFPAPPMVCPVPLWPAPDLTSGTEFAPGWWPWCYSAWATTRGRRKGTRTVTGIAKVLALPCPSLPDSISSPGSRGLHIVVKGTPPAFAGASIPTIKVSSIAFSLSYTAVRSGPDAALRAYSYPSFRPRHPAAVLGGWRDHCTHFTDEA